MTFNIFYCGDGLWNSGPWLEKTGSDEGGIALMKQKANILPIFVENLYCAAANILKQDMLSLGGEAAVHKYAINCKKEYTDVLLLGTLKQYNKIRPKLKAQSYWKLNTLGDNLALVIANVVKVSKMEIKELPWEYDEKESSFYYDLELTFDIQRDMGQLPLKKIDSSNKLIVKLNANFSESCLIYRNYTKAIQSKGYEVLLKIPQKQKPLLEFIKPNYYVFSENK